MEVICHPRLKYNGSNLSKRAHQAAIYPYLLRKVTASYPNHVWELDITYIRLRHNWLYLVAILDWYSRYVLALGTGSNNAGGLRPRSHATRFDAHSPSYL